MLWLLGHAQTSATKPPVPPHQILSTNPFGLLVNSFTAKYERKIAPATTVGVSASHFADPELSNAALVLRWYPQGAALDGFFVGARAGVYAFQRATVPDQPGLPAPTVPPDVSDLPRAHSGPPGRGTEWVQTGCSVPNGT